MKNSFFSLTVFTYIMLLVFSLASCSKNTPTHSTQFGESSDFLNHLNIKTDTAGLSNILAKMTTIHGDIVFRFYSTRAPKTSARIMKLIQDGFYNGLVFHRAIPNFVLQTGDPTGTGYGGSGVKLPFEPSDIQHVKGTIGLARSLDPSSGDSQFYICLSTLPHLDKQYTVFAQVIEGLEILDKLSKGDKILSIVLEDRAKK